MSDAAGSSAPQLPSCDATWPTAGRPPQPRPSLAARAPTVLWSTKVGTRQTFSPGRLSDNATLVEAKDNLALSTGRTLAIIAKRTGQLTQAEDTAVTDWMAPPVSDEEGTIYSLALSGIYSFSSSGKIQWRIPVPRPATTEFLQPAAPILSPDRRLYAVCGDGNLCEISIADQQRTWCVQDETRFASPSQVLGGAGRTILVQPHLRSLREYDTSSGAMLGSFVYKDGETLQAMVGYSWALGWTFQVQLGAIYSFDVCRRLRWSTTLGEMLVNASSVIALGERLVGTAWEVDSNGNRKSADQMHLYAADGAVVLGPVAGQGEPYLAGADGTIYTVNCAYSSPPANQLIAYTADLKELWRLDIGATGSCPLGNGVLDEDGVLFLAHSLGSGGGLEVIAIQTQSPGLADSSWPSLRHDNRATSWLTPLPPLPGAGQSTDGSSDLAVDASVDSALDVPLR